jgi:hypothetical protein
MKATLISLTVGAAVFFGSGSAAAQYPIPTGNTTLTSEVVVASIFDSFPIICTVLSVSGAPVPGAECTFTIELEPGGIEGDAAVGSKTITKLTDANGVATTILRTGSTPGQLIVSATSGTKRSVTVITVGGASGGPPAAPVVIPPSTGDGGLVN